MKKYKCVTFGCQMNVHDSEKIAGILESMGYKPTELSEEADIIVFNTCCIRDTAEKRAFGNIGALKQLKREKKDLIIAVVGCMPMQDGYTEIFKTKYPYVDIVLGTKSFGLIKKKIEALSASKKRIFDVSDAAEGFDDSVVTRTSYPNAWINIMTGCDNFCSYCIVPYVRGREVSRDFELVISEAKKVVDEGYKEITLLGQNVNSYKSGGKNFADVLSEIDKIEGKFRVRFMTSHPKDLSEEIIDAVAKSDKICNNVHLPVQSGSNAVLAAMNRKYTRERYFELIEMIKSKLGGVGITTDIMVGFPGETEKDFEDTLDLVEKCRFSNAFTFIYSARKNTAAAKLPQIPYDIKRRRIGELIKLQNKITKELSEQYINNEYEVLVEGLNDKYQGTVAGRTESGRLVTMPGGRELIGSFVNVLITESKSASLFGKII